MKTLYIITGTSSGIGEALSNFVLEQGNCHILGIARHQTITHPSYSHLHADLSASISHSILEEIQAFLSGDHSALKNLIFINNAGTINPIGPIGSLDQKKIEQAFFLNSISPFILSNFIINHSIQCHLSLKILNISTGASKRPIEGWSTYCATKAALAMMTQTWKSDSLQNNWNIEIEEFSPGVIDTPMQAEIRASKQEQFSHVEKFIKFKTEDALESPQVTAEKIYQFLHRPHE